jgi:co-chaperonin GroES (HSP10)
MKIVPSGNKVLILPLKKEEEKINGIIHAESTYANLGHGKVVEVSPQLSHLYPVGSTVLYNAKAGIGQHYEGALHLWLFHRDVDGDIWGTVTENE